MRHSFPLELCLRLSSMPVIIGQLPKVHIECFRNERAGRDRTITRRERFRFSMTFMQYNCMNSVQLTDRGELYFIDDGINKKLKMFDGCNAPIKVVGSSNRVKI